jgi:hypothetical protein
MNIKRSHIIIGIIVTIIVVAAGWFLLRPQGTVEFRLAPETVTLTLDGKNQSITKGNTITLKPGSYNMTFTRDEFSSEKRTVVVKNHETTKVTIALTPQTDAARKIISDNAESVKITEEYKTIRADDLAVKMPIKGTSFSIKSCPSIKHPGTKDKAFCIVTINSNSERIARLYLKEQGFNPDHLELLSGSSNLMTLLKTPSYKVEAYITDTADKPSLYITPLNVPYVDNSVPYNQQLEDIRTASLADLEKNGYKLDNYTIVFSNIYLTKYNADHVHEGEGYSVE